MDAARRKLKFLRKVPNKATKWKSIALRNNLSRGEEWLVLEMPDANSSNGVIIVDTGSESGVGLPPQKWLEWKAANTKQPITFVASYMAEPGLIVREQSWAKELSLGPLELTEVIVGETNPMTLKAVPADQTVTLGMAALKRLNLIVDGKHGVAYVRAKQTPAPPRTPSDPDRRELIFVPRDKRSDDLVAHVLGGSSAFGAGIRNGDVLLKIDERDAAKWRTDPGDRWRIAPNRPFISASTNYPPGTKIEMIVKRGDQTLKTTVDLEKIAIFAPQTNWPASLSK